MAAIVCPFFVLDLCVVHYSYVQCSGTVDTIVRVFQNLKIQMKDFEATAEPLQEWLTTTERMVQGSSSRLHDLPSKRREQQKLQVTSYKPF